MSRGRITISHGTFATAINCMDGRVQLPVIAYLKSKYVVDYVDAITEPGRTGSWPSTGIGPPSLQSGAGWRFR